MSINIPKLWMPNAKMERIHVHWTAGAYKPNATDRKHYHILIDGDGVPVRGIPSIKLNEAPVKKGYAAHTRYANSRSIAVSICAMGGPDVTEVPFNAGKYPLLMVQWDAMLEVVAILAKEYGIPVTPHTILTHAEVQPNLGIQQRGKWDITRLPFAPDVRGYKAVGDLMRKGVATHLDAVNPPKRELPASMLPKKYEVRGVHPSMLNFRDGPNGKDEGDLPEGTIVERVSKQGNWMEVRTPLGYVGWVYASYLKELK